jgi:hypothetical protein
MLKLPRSFSAFDWTLEGFKKKKTPVERLYQRRLSISSVCRVYSEEQPGEAATALFIKQVSSQDAGRYRSVAFVHFFRMLEFPYRDWRTNRQRALKVRSTLLMSVIQEKRHG